MKWFYIWSEKYVEFHNYLKDVIPKEFFEIKPIYIPQERFDIGLYKYNSLHPWTGCNIKVSEIIRILEEDVEEGEMFLFTDVDIALRPNSNIFDILNIYKNIIDIHMVFSPEGSTIQIGSMLLHKNFSVSNFWKRVLERCVENPTQLDQDIIKNELISYKGKWLVFENRYILNSLNISKENISTFIIANLLVDVKDSQYNLYWKKKEFNIILHLMLENGLVDAEYKNVNWMHTSFPKIAVISYGEEQPDNDIIIYSGKDIFDFFYINKICESLIWKNINSYNMEKYNFIIHIDSSIKKVKYDHIVTQLYYYNLIKSDILLVLAADPQGERFHIKSVTSNECSKIIINDMDLLYSHFLGNT